MGTFDNFKAILLVQLFFSFAITSLAYSMPSGSLNYIQSFTDTAQAMNGNDAVSQLQGSLTQQKNLPIIDLGALVFYSGNYMIDLLFNFMYAIPQMFQLLINGILFLFNIQSPALAYLELFVSSCWVAFYILGIIQMLLNIRSRAGIQ